MAEMDAKTLKEFDDRLKSMVGTLGELEGNIKAVGTAITNSFGTATQNMVKEVQQAFRGIQLSDMLGVDLAKRDIKELGKEIATIEGNIKSKTSNGTASYSEKKNKWVYTKGNVKLTEEGEVESIEKLNRLYEKLKYSMMSREELLLRIQQTSGKMYSDEQRDLKKLQQEYYNYEQKVAIAKQNISAYTKGGSDSKQTKEQIAFWQKQADDYTSLMNSAEDKINKYRENGVRLSLEEEAKMRLAQQEKLNQIENNKLGYASKEWKKETSQRTKRNADLDKRADEYRKSIEALTKAELELAQAEENLRQKQSGKANGQPYAENTIKGAEKSVAVARQNIIEAEEATKRFGASLASLKGGAQRLNEIRAAFGLIAESGQEAQKIPTVFDRVIAEINSRSERSKSQLAKSIIDAKSVRDEAKAAALGAAKELSYIWKGASVHGLDALKLRSTFSLTDFGIQGIANQIKLSDQYKANLDALKPEAREKLTEALNRYKEALQQVISLEEQKRRFDENTDKYSAQERAINGVTKRYQENEQAIQKLKDRWEELNVKKQAGLVNEKDFKQNTQKILDEYDRLINKRKEFEIGDLGEMSANRQKRITQIYKDNARTRVQDELNADKKIAAERARRARGLASTDPNMNAAVNKQIQYQRQLNALRKEYNTLNAKQDRSSEENVILEQTKQKIKDIITLSRQLNNEQKGSHNLAKQITDYDRIKQKIREANAANREHKESVDKMLYSVQRLASAFGMAFSVQGLVQFGKKLIETRGEFEMQFVAMKQIIGDVDAATKIWNQTMQQALQSPFKAMQLVDYTKKLAAYRVETEKLFDTTKRLADVSAGLGVDMGRLILAYGQVKTANFLRASEVRQFTEAGVNIYDNLAKYFSEIEGRAVSTAEVVERVTKRMVLFSDVEEIFKRMTDEGGTFYNMQEVQADTVRGQIMKLHDAYDQMLNTIGQANQGALRDLVESANRIVRGWRDVAFFLKLNIPILLTSIPLWYSMKKISKMTGDEMAILSKKVTLLRNSIIKASISTKEGAGAFRMWRRQLVLSSVESAAFEKTLQTLIISGKVLKGVFRTMLPFLLIEGAIGLITSMTSSIRKSKELKNELQDISKSQKNRGNEEISGYEKLQDELKRTNAGSIERGRVIQQLNDKYGVYLDKLFDENSSLQDIADGYKLVSERANEAARARALEEGYSKISSKYNQERADWIYDLAKGPNSYTGGFGKGGTFLTTGGVFSISKNDAKGFSDYVETIVSKNNELYESMSLTERQEAIREMYKNYFNEELPAGAAELFNFIDNTVDRIKELREFENNLSDNFDLKALTKRQKEVILNLRDEAKEAVENIEKAEPGNIVELPTGVKLEVKRTDKDVSDILTFVKNKIRDKAKEKEVDVRLSMGTIGFDEANKLKDKIGKLADPVAQQINERIIEEIKKNYGVNGDIWDYIIGNPWDNNMNEMLHAINTSLLTQNDIQQGIGKASSYVEGRLQGQLSVLAEINKKKNSGLITDEKQLKALEDQRISVEGTYKWLQRTLFLLKEKAETSEVKDALLSEETIKKAKEKVQKKYGENVASEIKIGASFDYASIDKLQSEVAKTYHDAGDAIDKEIKSIKASANADKEKIKMLEKQRDIQYALADAYGYVDTKKKKGETESVSKMVSLLKDMNTEYEKLTKSAYGYAKSEKEVRRSFENSFNEIYKKLGAQKVNGKYPTIIDFNETDFTTKTGIVAAYEKVLKYVKENVAKYNKDAVADLEKRISEMNVAIGMDVQVRIREDFAREMEDALGNYELTLDLQKLNLPTDLMEDMFDMEAVDMTTLRQKITDFYNELKAAGDDVDRTDMEKVEQYVKKLDDMERKAQRDRIKEYAKYLEYELSERAKISMDYAKKIADVQTERSIPADKREKIVAGLTKEMNEKLAKQDWEDFKGSEVYVQMMEDLEKHGTVALSSMRKELELIRENAKNLSPRALKEVVSAIEKIREIELNRMDPFAGLKNSIADVNESLAKAGVSSKGELYAEAEANERNLVLTQRRKQEVDRIVAAQDRAVEIQKELNKLMKYQEISEVAYNTDIPIDKEVDAYKELLKEYEDEFDKLSDEDKALVKERLALSKELGRLTTESFQKNTTENRKQEISSRTQEIENRVKEIDTLLDGKKIGENMANGIIDAIKRVIKLRGELAGISEEDISNADAKEEQSELSDREKQLQELQKKYNKAVQDIDNYNKQVQRLISFFGEWTGKVQSLWSDLSNLAGAYSGEFSKFMGNWGKAFDVSLQQIENITRAFGEFKNAIAEYQKSATKKTVEKSIDELDNTAEDENTVKEDENTSAVNRNTSARGLNTTEVDANTESIKANTRAKIENANADKKNDGGDVIDIAQDVVNSTNEVPNGVADAGIEGNTVAINANTAAKVENATAGGVAATANAAVGETAAASTPAVATFGATLTAVMGWVGLIAAALSALMTIITAVSSAHDDSIEDDIEDEQKKIDELQAAYGRLEKQIEKTWSSMSYMDVYEKQIENIKRQIAAIERQRALERSKKNSDSSKIAGYNNEINEAYDKLEELKQKQIEVFGGIGEVNYRSAAEGFVEAWKEAFLETGDGLQGLKDHFDEFLEDWFVKQATMRVAGKMLEPVFNQIDSAVGKYSEGGSSAMLSEIQKARELAASIFPDMSDALQELAGMFDISGEGGLSGLAAGIQGMTEEQANILEAYWNSVRMYTANIDINVERIANILGAGGDNANPMLGKLDSIISNTAYIKRIYDMLEPMQTNNGSGRGFRTYNL